MPVYDYECDECKNRFEVRQRFVEEPVTICPSCGGHVRRVYHPVGIVFKGSGFYVTDNRKSGETASTTTAKESKPAEGKATETKSTESKSTETKSAESKPAASS